MTANQIVVLFDVYRGFDVDRHAGTVEGDLQLLIRKGLIKTCSTSNFGYSMTEKGGNLINIIQHITEL